MGIFTGGTATTNNCAVVPGTNDLLSVNRLGIIPPTTSFNSNRAVALNNLETRINDANRPPTTPNGFVYPTGELVNDSYSQNAQWAVKFLSVPLTCSYDAINERNSGQPIPVTIVIANLNDEVWAPAVAIAESSIRWSTRPDPDYPNIAEQPIPDAVIKPKVESGPTTPTNVRAKLSGKAAIEVTWSRPKDPGTGKIKHYLIYRNGQKLNPPVSANAFRFVDRQLDVNQSYYYSVVAVSTVGESAKSTKTNSMFPRK